MEKVYILLGIIFGANIGTTITAWIVFLIGFKFSVLSILIPAFDIGKVSKEYFVWWGIEGKKIIEFAKEELLLLGNKKEPFMFSVFLEDTHAKGGFLCEDCEKKYPVQIHNVFINSAIESKNTKNRDYCTFDYFPTIIESMGIKFNLEDNVRAKSLFYRNQLLNNKQ